MNLHIIKELPDTEPEVQVNFSPWACLATWGYVAAFWAIVLLLIL